MTTITIDPNTATDEELLALNDPWVTMYVNELKRLDGEKKTDELMHMAGSFGRPGSMTEGGQRYRQHSLEQQITHYQLTLCLLYKGYATVDQFETLKGYDGPPPKGKR